MGACSFCFPGVSGRAPSLRRWDGRGLKAQPAVDQDEQTNGLAHSLVGITAGEIARSLSALWRDTMF
jgi:hypothetical protein